MEFDFERLAADDRYKILTSTVVPRPIAWVSSLSQDGVRNAAPFSFFNAMSKTPPIIAIGIQANADGSMKDSARNILETREFVVNLVPRSAAQAMSFTSIEAPPDVDELALGELATLPSVKVRPERIAVSPIAFECRLHTPIEIAPSQLIVLGEIGMAHVADAFVLDPVKCYIDTHALNLIGRMQGRGWYTTTDAVFEIKRPDPYVAP